MKHVSMIAKNNSTTHEGPTDALPDEGFGNGCGVAWNEGFVGV